VKCLKVPKCEIFDFKDSRDFCTIKPPWVGDFGTVIKNSKLFRFCHDYEVIYRENFELVNAEDSFCTCKPTFKDIGDSRYLCFKWLKL
jgi:hypothetical protein